MGNRSLTARKADAARRLWLRLEHIAAVSYFDSGCIEALRAIGLRDFWMGYFASRAAPLGPVGPGVVEALFFNSRRGCPSFPSLMPGSTRARPR